MRGGELGIWAKTVGIEGLGGEASGNHETSSEETYQFESIDTEYFYADNDYITQAMNKKDVKEFMKGNGYAPVYIVTGLKIARRPAVSVTSGKKRGVRGEASISQPEVLPIDSGMKGSLTNEGTKAMEFQDSEDFVIGIRVKKVKYTLWGRITGSQTLSVKKHDRRATLVGEGNETQESVFEVEEMLDENQTGMGSIMERDAKTESILWLLPKRYISL
ncbi:major facilitator superfamily MFS-1 [Colletotrichum sp. SAR 10_86]|nr:major facilitator superfamily MFS-1 [Colletotrichum sp. SAR 10_65]KAI8230383.1 major facilitator superfamily MFS-1 [Colletotrichum sp. SAR 10_86]